MVAGGANVVVFTTRSSRSQNATSIGKRMNIMWIPLLSGSHRAASGSSEARPIRPLNLAQRLDATSTRAATIVARVVFRAVRIA